MVGDVEARRRAEVAVGAGVGLVFAEVEDVAVAEVPVEVIGAGLETVGVEAAEFLLEAARAVGADEEAVGAGGGEAVVAGDVTGLFFSAGGLAGAGLADVGGAGEGLPVAEGVDR